jgi:hypothetical protein
MLATFEKEVDNHLAGTCCAGWPAPAERTRPVQELVWR